MASRTTKNTSETSTGYSSKSTSRRVLDEAMLDAIMSGLSGQMTQKELETFAENLLRPQFNAGLEAAQQQYESEKLSREQEIEDLATALASSIAQQKNAYRQSMADVETAALSRGMGRSSYTLESLAKQGDALAEAVAALTGENERKTQQIRKQITQSAEQNAQTQGRLKNDFAAQMAAKIEELSLEQQKERNSQYMTAISAAMGQETTSESQTKSEKTTNTTNGSRTRSNTLSTSGKTSASGKKTKEDTVDAVSGAAMSVKQMIK